MNRYWRDRFARLPVPPVASRTGDWQVTFVGPGWLRRSAPIAIAAAGLPGWSGKRLLAADRAVNCLADGRTVLPMQVAEALSVLDGRPVLAFTYGPAAPWPWCRVRDEIRALAPGRWLGMTVVALPGLRRVGWPFELVRRLP